MFEKLTKQAFGEQLGTRFEVRLSPNQALELELKEAVGINRRSGRQAVPGERESFSLLFVGPREPVLPQRMYPLEHAVMGKFELFLVPIGRDEHGSRYEAIFNFAVPS